MNIVRGDILWGDTVHYDNGTALRACDWSRSAHSSASHPSGISQLTRRHFYSNSSSERLVSHLRVDTCILYSQLLGLQTQPSPHRYHPVSLPLPLLLQPIKPHRHHTHSHHRIVVDHPTCGSSTLTVAGPQRPWAIEEPTLLAS